MEMTCRVTGRLSPIALAFHIDEPGELSNTVLARVPEAALYRIRINRKKPAATTIFAVTLMAISAGYRFRDSTWVRIMSATVLNRQLNITTSPKDKNFKAFYHFAKCSSTTPPTEER